MDGYGAKLGRGEESYRRYLDGDESAFETIVELYFEELILFANGYVRDMHASEDVALDTLLELTYLFSIARNKAVDRLRRLARERSVPLDEAIDIGEDTLAREVLDNELKRSVLRAVDGLPPDMRAAVYLVCIDGMSYDEAGRVLKKPRKQIDNLLVKAKKKLRTILGEEAAELIRGE